MSSGLDWMSTKAWVGVVIVKSCPKGHTVCDKLPGGRMEIKLNVNAT